MSEKMSEREKEGARLAAKALKRDFSSLMNLAALLGRIAEERGATGCEEYFKDIVWGSRLEHRYKILWASRHELTPEAEKALKEMFVLDGDEIVEIEHRDITWPAGACRCSRLALKLEEQYDLITGVFPAQALEAFREEEIEAWSPVSEPVKEPDTGRVREFRFVRWARVS